MNKQEQTRLQRATQAKLRFVCLAFLSDIAAADGPAADRIAEDKATAGDYLLALDVLEKLDATPPEAQPPAAPKAPGTGKPGRPPKTKPDVPPEPDPRQTTLEITTPEPPAEAGETSPT